MARPARRRLLPRLRALPLLLLVAAAPAAATSYVPIEDGALADQAALIAEVRVEAVSAAPAARQNGRPATDYRVTVLSRVKGEMSGWLLVREPGGDAGNGLRLEIDGVPVLTPGEEALLFLVPHDDGTYGILHLLLGAFPAATVDGRRIVLRSLAGATAVGPEADGALSAPEDRPRDLDRFAAWLADRAAGSERPADYFVDLPADARRSLAERFTFIPDRNGRHVRWFEFDFGASIPWLAHASGQPGVPGGGFDEFQRALAAWNDESRTAIRYTYTGTTTATGGLKTFDSVNAILFDDPNQEIDGAFNCAAGGILAVSSPWVRSGNLGTFQSETFSQIVGADIISNDNIACYLTSTGDPGKAAEEIFAHELGHTLGLLHACGDQASPPCIDPVKNDALMRAFVHGDGRGARLGSDDVAGIRYLYDPSPRNIGGIVSCRPSSTVLCLDGRRFKAELFWRNQFDRSAGLGLAVPATDATGYFSFGDPSNLELLVKVLDFGGTIKVFYGELTNLQFTLTLTDTVTGVIKTYRNTSGDCGGIDQNFFGIAASTATPRRAARGACRPDRQTLCLLDNRFAVRVHWRNPFNGASGDGGPNALSNLVGTFYFTDRNNVELMTKILPFSDRLAFFYGALSDLAYTIQVTDTATGAVKTYQSTPSRLCGGLDNNAF